MPGSISGSPLCGLGRCEPPSLSHVLDRWGTELRSHDQKCFKRSLPPPQHGERELQSWAYPDYVSGSTLDDLGEYWGEYQYYAFHRRRVFIQQRDKRQAQGEKLRIPRFHHLPGASTAGMDWGRNVEYDQCPLRYEWGTERWCSTAQADFEREKPQVASTGSRWSSSPYWLDC